MNINTNKIVSISEANQVFSKVVRMVERSGEVYIFKNDKPKNRLANIENDAIIEMSCEEKLTLYLQEY